MPCSKSHRQIGAATAAHRPINRGFQRLSRGGGNTRTRCSPRGTEWNGMEWIPSSKRLIYASRFTDLAIPPKAMRIGEPRSIGCLRFVPQVLTERSAIADHGNKAHGGALETCSPSALHIGWGWLLKALRAGVLVCHHGFARPQRLSSRELRRRGRRL